MECPRCNAHIADSAKFCNQCGATIGDSACPACGHNNKAGAQFCGGCGQLVGQEKTPQQSSYQISAPSNQSMGFSVGSSGHSPHEEVKPPYGYAIIAIVLGIVTATIVPSIIGIFMLVRCVQASNANNRFDYEEAKRLAHQATWNPLGLSTGVRWVLGIIAVIGIIIGIIALTSY